MLTTVRISSTVTCPPLSQSPTHGVGVTVGVGVGTNACVSVALATSVGVDVGAAPCAVVCVAVGRGTLGVLVGGAAEPTNVKLSRAKRKPALLNVSTARRTGVPE